MQSRIYLSCLLIIIGTNIFAQSNVPNWTIGVEVGTSYFQNLFDKKEDLTAQEDAAADTVLGQRQKASPLAGLTIGLVTSKKLIGGLTFDFGVYFAQGGTRYSYTDFKQFTDTKTYIAEVDEEYLYRYLEVPLQLGYGIPLLKWLSLDVNLGVSPSYLFQLLQTQEVDFPMGQTLTSEQTIEDDIQEFNLNGLGGLGVNFRFKRVLISILGNAKMAIFPTRQNNKFYDERTLAVNGAIRLSYIIQ